MKKKPDFISEEEERVFWESHDSSEYIDWSESSRVIFPNLKPTTERKNDMKTPPNNSPELGADFFKKAVHTTATTAQGIADEVHAKVSTTIRLPAEVLAYFKADGQGWQTRISNTLAEYVREHSHHSSQ